MNVAVLKIPTATTPTMVVNMVTSASALTSQNITVFRRLITKLSYFIARCFDKRKRVEYCSYVVASRRNSAKNISIRRACTANLG